RKVGQSILFLTGHERSLPVVVRDESSVPILRCSTLRCGAIEERMSSGSRCLRLVNRGDPACQSVIGDRALSAEPEIVHVSLGDRSYDIVIGSDLLRDAGDMIADWCERSSGSARARSAAIITDNHVMSHAERVAASLAAADWNAELIAVEPGEGSKCLP